MTRMSHISAPKTSWELGQKPLENWGSPLFNTFGPSSWLVLDAENCAILVNTLSQCEEILSCCFLALTCVFCFVFLAFQKTRKNTIKWPIRCWHEWSISSRGYLRFWWFLHHLKDLTEIYSTAQTSLKTEISTWTYGSFLSMSQFAVDRFFRVFW